LKNGKSIAVHVCWGRSLSFTTNWALQISLGIPISNLTKIGRN